jgi:hypothetical protein
MQRARFLKTPILLALAFVVLGAAGSDRFVAAGPINPMAYKQKFEQSKKDAAVVAQVRVLAVVCTEVMGEGKARTANLQISMQVLDNEKGPIKKNDVLVVPHKVSLPAGPGPGM